jgi:hypothetical protein
LLGGGGVVSYAILTNPTNGTLATLNTNTGVVAYTPNTTYVGADYFRFTVSAGGQQATGAVSLTITAVNHAPIAYTQSVTNWEDTSCAITLTGSDVDGPETNFVVMVGPANGTLSGTPPNLMYRGATNYFGRDSFTFSINDGSLTSAVATVSITVLPVNHPPVANDDHYDLGGGVALDIPGPGVLSNDSAPEGDSLIATLVTGPHQGVLNLSPSGGFNYTPTNHFNGLDTFTYQASDGQTNSGPATVGIVVSNLMQIVSLGLSNDLVTVIWTSILGKGYRLQFKDSWADPDWTDVAPDVRASGTTAIGTNAVEAVPQRIYRVLDLGP